jgi:hypothetical protein
MAATGPRLYHYTSGAGLKGILERKVLWATHIYYLNDHTEYEAVFTTAKGLLPRITVLREMLPAVPCLHKAIVDDLHPYDRGRPACIFVTCFSEHRDDLSQWRGYTQPGDGYALHFDRGRLAARAERAGWRLAKVDYQEGSARPPGELRLAPLLVDTFTNYTATGPDTPGRAAEAVAKLSNAIVDFAPICKDRAFSNENEWRLISPRFDDWAMKFEYRVGRSFLVPYIEFPLHGAEFDDIPGVETGPGPNTNLAQNAAMTMGRQNGINIGGGIAAAPYRPW